MFPSKLTPRLKNSVSSKAFCSASDCVPQTYIFLMPFCAARQIGVHFLIIISKIISIFCITMFFYPVDPSERQLGDRVLPVLPPGGP